MISRSRHRNWRALAADLERAGTARGREQLGGYVIEGWRLHERALRAGARIEACLVGETLQGERSSGEPNRAGEVAAAVEQAGVPVLQAPDAEISRLTEGRTEGALVSLLRFPDEQPSLDDLLAEQPEGTPQLRPPTLVVLADVDDPGNVGAILRTALASGVRGAFCSGASDPYHPRAVRTSRGSLFKLPILRRGALEPLLLELGQQGVLRLATVAEGGVPLPELSPTGGPVAVILGNEAFGLPQTGLQAVDLRVTIPMAPGVDSFSVNAAAAVVLYQLRQVAARGAG